MNTPAAPADQKEYYLNKWKEENTEWSYKSGDDVYFIDGTDDDNYSTETGFVCAGQEYIIIEVKAMTGEYDEDGSPWFTREEYVFADNKLIVQAVSYPSYIVFNKKAYVDYHIQETPTQRLVCLNDNSLVFETDNLMWIPVVDDYDNFAVVGDQLLMNYGGTSDGGVISINGKIILEQGKLKEYAEKYDRYDSYDEYGFAVNATRSEKARAKYENILASGSFVMTNDMNNETFSEYEADYYVVNLNGEITGPYDYKSLFE